VVGALTEIVQHAFRTTIAHLILIDSEELTCSPSSGFFECFRWKRFLAGVFVILRVPANAIQRRKKNKGYPEL
jgi:hypothetical protein